jgi:hypothetical protein
MRRRKQNENYRLGTNNTTELAWHCENKSRIPRRDGGRRGRREVCSVNGAKEGLTGAARGRGRSQAGEQEDKSVGRVSRADCQWRRGFYTTATAAPNAVNGFLILASAPIHRFLFLSFFGFFFQQRCAVPSSSHATNQPLTETTGARQPYALFWRAKSTTAVKSHPRA